jgi:hypothetical protein
LDEPVAALSAVMSISVSVRLAVGEIEMPRSDAVLVCTLSEGRSTPLPVIESKCWTLRLGLHAT